MSLLEYILIVYIEYFKEIKKKVPRQSVKESQRVHISGKSIKKKKSKLTRVFKRRFAVRSVGRSYGAQPPAESTRVRIEMSIQRDVGGVRRTLHRHNEFTELYNASDVIFTVVLLRCGRDE